MTKLNFTRKFLVSAITLFAVNFAVANDENISNLNTLPLEKLPRLNAQEKVSLAGFSSGAFTAVNYQIAYSNNVSKVAIISGGAYNCGKDFEHVKTHCLNPKSENMLPTFEHQQTIIKNFANQKLIDNPDNLKNHKVWLYAAKNDQTVNFLVMQNLNDFYNNIFQKNSDNQKQFVITENDNHVWVSNLAKNTCEIKGTPPYVNYCNGYDMAENYLKFLFSNQVSNDKNKNIKGRFIKFSQSDIQQKYNIKNAEMADEGFAFIPKQCESKDNVEKSTCAIHFVLHGCSQSADMVDNNFVYQSGVWQYATNYNLIVVYPQTKKTEKNPYSCWDFYAFTGENYATNKAPQLQTLNAIAKELQSK